MKAVASIGLDIAKQVFQAHGADKMGRAVLRRKLRRNEVVRFFSYLEPCFVSIEASGSAHYWARVLEGLGQAIRLMAPQFVKPYVIEKIPAESHPAGAAQTTAVAPRGFRGIKRAVYLA